MDAIKEAMIREEFNGLPFEKWMKRVNEICLDLINVDAQSQIHWNWAEAHEDGLTPREAFDCMYQDLYDEEGWQAANAQFGVGA